jgi:monoamine oxidase
VRELQSMAEGPSTTLNRRRFVKGAVATGAAAAVGAGAVAAAGCGSNSSEKHVDVVVVGGGMSGLYAARTLRPRRSVVLLEASDRLGGRVLNLKTGPGPNDVTEAGAQWISPKEPHIQGLMREFRLKTFKNYSAGKYSLIVDGKVTSADVPFTAFSVPALVELGLGVAALDEMAAQVPVDAPWTAPKAEEWDAQTAETWVKANASSPVGQSFLAFVTGGPVSVLPGDISLLHYLFIAAAAGGPLGMMVLGSGELSDRIVGGTGRLVEGLARPLKEITKMGSPVTMIEHGRNNVRVTTPDERYVAEHVVVAMAPTMTQQILFDPVLPVQRTQSVQRIGMGSAIKCFPIYPTAFWRSNGLNGNVLSNSTPFGAAFDNSPPGGSPGVMFALVENAHARRFSTLTAEQRKAEVVDGLALFLGEEARHPTGYVEHDWSTDPWIRGGAASFFPPGVLTEYRSLFGEPIGRLHFAGTETGQRWWGNMEAALATGERAAKEILAA